MIEKNTGSGSRQQLLQASVDGIDNSGLEVPFGESSTSDFDSFSETLTTPQQAPDTTTTSTPDTSSDTSSSSSSPLEVIGGDTSTQQTSPPSEASAPSSTPTTSTTSENGGIKNILNPDILNPDTQTSSTISGTTTDTAPDSQSSSAASQSPSDSNAPLLPTTTLPTDTSGSGITASSLGQQSPSSTAQGDYAAVSSRFLSTGAFYHSTSWKCTSYKWSDQHTELRNGQTSVTSEPSSSDTGLVTDANGGIVPTTTAAVPTLGDSNQSPVVGATSMAASSSENGNPLWLPSIQVKPTQPQRIPILHLQLSSQLSALHWVSPVFYLCQVYRNLARLLLRRRILVLQRAIPLPTRAFQYSSWRSIRRCFSKSWYTSADGRWLVHCLDKCLGSKCGS